ncbi:MAG: DUF4038 domain-containing protein [Chitinophagaceae bacterium]|nr:MAG: DUF4038 domain-containing protein [Chitinophagaceae bacterium]
MKKLITGIILLAFTLPLAAQKGKLPALKVGPDNRSLVTSENKAFFWLGDTGWELFHRLSKPEAELYLKTRADQGFTVIQAVALAELDGIKVPNAEGQLPLVNEDPGTPNEAYFKHVDWIIAKAESLGLYIAFLPTWGDKLNPDTWGKGPAILKEENAAKYGEWLGKRYKNTTNIIWVLGGDRLPRNDSDVMVWRAMANGINKGVGGKEKTLMTYHPQPSETSSSSPWFHKEPWFDFNMLQTGHCNDVDVWNKVAGDLNLLPAKPVVNAEPLYEDHPICFDAKKNGYSTAYDVRKSAYLSVFAGSFGITYGCHAVWQFYTKEREGVNGPLKPWQESLKLEAASQMTYLRKLMTSVPIIGLVPDQSMIVDARDSTERIQAVRGKDFLMVYTAAGLKFQLKTGKISGSNLKGYWFDPRTGRQVPVKQIPNKGEFEFTAPSSGKGNDWVLVLRGS